MPLFLLVYRTDGDLNVSIQEAQSLIGARIRALAAGAAGEFAEGHQLDSKIARKVPTGMVGRPLTRNEAEELLTKLA